MNKVILITNQEEVKKKIQDNNVLLRTTDGIYSSTYDNAPDVLYDLRPDIILLHEHEKRDKTLNLLKYITGKKIFENSNVIVLVNQFDRAFILAAYDNGAEDYISVNSEPVEFLIRIINSIKKSGLQNKIKRLNSNLEYYGIIDNISGFYNPKFENEVMNTELNKGNYDNSAYMIITPDENGKKIYSNEIMIQAIKKSVRIDDIVIGPSGSRYSLLMNTGIDGAVKILDKIKSELPEDASIKAGITIVNEREFDSVKKKATCALNNSLLENKAYTIFSKAEVGDDDWLEISKDDEKAFKLFKNAFSKKLENVIAPVFYRVQKSYEEQIGDAKIEQFTDEQQSIFRIICGKYESRLTMIYPAFSKIVIYITHSGLDSPENREITLPLSQINQNKIGEILESFVNEFIGVYRHIYSKGQN